MAETTTDALPAGSPARWAAFIGTMVGAAMSLFGVWLLFSTVPAPLAVAFILCGLLEAVTSVFSLRVARAAWAFACSLNGTLFIFFLLGAPNLRDRAEISIGYALLPAFLFGVLTLLYNLGSDDY